MLLAHTLTVCASQILVSTASQINSGNWKSGDTIVMKNGTWVDQLITLKATGTASQPIVLMAQTLGLVILTGSSHLGFSGNYIVISGLLFKNGTQSSSEIIGFRTSSVDFANNCRLTNCTIVDCNPADSTIDTKWVSLYGAKNKVDHCSFQNKSNMGTLMVAWLQTGIIPNHVIDQNYFGYRNSNLDAAGSELNGQEIIRLGDSSTSMLTAGIQVTNNFFEHCNGEIEIISNKSCGNYFSNNVFFECHGMLTLRHGNGCTVDGNYFFGNKLSDTGGVRIIGENHKVYNNYFEKLGGTGFRSAISIVRGKLNSLANEYFQVKNALVAFNTMVDCSNAFTINYNSSSTYTMPPIGTVIANNNIYNTSNSNSNINISQTDTAMHILWKNNMMNQGKYTNFSYSASEVITGKDPKMSLAGTAMNMYEPSIGSALADYSTSDYPDILVDIRGRDRASSAKIPGASQMLGSTSRNMPSRKSVGASFFSNLDTEIRPIGTCPEISAFINNKLLTIRTSTDGNLCIYSISGESVFQKAITEGTITTKLYNKGIYILRFTTKIGRLYCQKLVVN